MSDKLPHAGERHEGIGRELYKAATYDQAKETIEPYVRLLSDEG